MRTKKAFYNSMASMLYEVIAAISAMILPRLILTRFGSDYNGVIASITQFVSYISLFTAGVGAVTRAALYKPLADGDTEKISGITRATEMFMRKVVIIFSAGLLVFSILYPFLLRDEFDWLFIFSLVLILGTKTFSQYFFGISYQMILQADQRGYINTLLRSGTIIVNTIVSVALILAGFELRIVMLASALIFVANRIVTHRYVKAHYNIIRPIEPDNEAIKQRWDAFAHQAAGFVFNNTSVIILTIFAGIKEVSVYAVYYLVIKNIKTIIYSLMGTGIQALFGNMLVKNEQKALLNGLNLYEFLTNSLSVVFYTCTALLVVPFVTVYTNNVVDVDYIRPLFAYVACATQFFFILRTPYQSIVQAAGHFKQTRNASIAEMSINIVLSVILVIRFGLIGVAIGSLCAMMLRTIQYAVYISRHIVNRSIWVVVRKMCLSALNVVVIVVLTRFLPDMSEVTYRAWVIHALPTFGIAVGVTALFTMMFYRKDVKMLIRKLRTLSKKETEG